MVTNVEGDSYIVWRDSGGIYAQKLDSYGNKLWLSGGVPEESGNRL